jgi:hypothetical protein
MFYARLLTFKSVRLSVDQSSEHQLIARGLYEGYDNNNYYHRVYLLIKNQNRSELPCKDCGLT